MSDPPVLVPLPRPIDVRRALLGHLITSGGPATLDDLVAALAGAFGAAWAEPGGRRQVAELARYQVRLGRVRRVRCGVYEIVPGTLSRSTAWRCVNWRGELARAAEHRAHPPAGSGTTA